MKKILFIDNFDSFVHLLADEFKKRHCAVKIFRSTMPLEACLKTIAQEVPDALVFSPGPGTPEAATLCLELLAHAPESLPILGVCLGHQCLVHYYQGKVARAKEILHGKMSMLTHEDDGLFKDLPNPMPVGRYHSLSAAKVHAPLRVTAMAGNEVMAVAHRALPRVGVQFHPESLLTPFGGKLIENFLC